MRGILKFSCHMKKVPTETYNNLVRFSRRLENVVLRYLPSHVIRHMARAKEAVDYQTMKGIGLDSSEEPQFYSSIACGVNLVLSSHIDPVDFTYCAVFAFKLDYGPRDKEKTLVYFTFPGLGKKGMSVKMWHGQVVIFNAHQVCFGVATYIICIQFIDLDCLFQYHSISSRKFLNDRVLCVSMYLKSSIVSGNDNSVPVTGAQEDLARDYEEMIGSH